ncbi:uncharacterized protein LOC144451930 isoform X1 [Glandiceps talaboti]
MTSKGHASSVESDEFGMMASDPKMPYLSSAYHDRIRPCIDLVDSLRRIGLDKDIDLPAVVVIGDQSVGKSSVLEAISGVQLPRGTEIVTRCPVELRLKNIDENDWRGRIRYTSHSKDVVDRYIDDPEHIGDEIKKAQNDITGSAKGISDSLITVQVESMYVPNLTLIDLPGIARVALDGQPGDIGDKTKSLIRKYISKEETIILCVIPCNVDIATTEAIKLAQEVDPNGTRTLGVMTKPDLVDAGTESNVVKVAQNKVLPLKKGYTVIKCRGQKKVESKQPLDEAMDEEDRFFKEHRIYNVLYHDRCAGTRMLANRLTTELVEQIRKSVPQLQRGIKTKLEETNQELAALGDSVPTETVERIDLLVRILARFPEDFNNAADGVYKGATWDRSLRLQTIVKRHYEKFADELESLQAEWQTVTDVNRTALNQSNRGMAGAPGYRGRSSGARRTTEKSKTTSKSLNTNKPLVKEISQNKNAVKNESVQKVLPKDSKPTMPYSQAPSPKREEHTRDRHMTQNQPSFPNPISSMPCAVSGTFRNPHVQPNTVEHKQRADTLPPNLTQGKASVPVAKSSHTLPHNQKAPPAAIRTNQRSPSPTDWDMVDDDLSGFKEPQQSARKSKFFQFGRKRKDKTPSTQANSNNFQPERYSSIGSPSQFTRPNQTRSQQHHPQQIPGQLLTGTRPESNWPSLPRKVETIEKYPFDTQSISSVKSNDSSSDEEYYSPTEGEKSPVDLKPKEYIDGAVGGAIVAADAITKREMPIDEVIRPDLSRTDTTSIDDSISNSGVAEPIQTSSDDAVEATPTSTQGDQHLPDIKEEIREQKGLELPPFIKDRPICENLIRQIIKEFIAPAERLLQAVNFEVERIGQKLVTDTYIQFPRLQTTVMSKFCDLQQEAVQATKEAIDIKFKMEDMIQTQDRIYADTESLMLQSRTSQSSASSSSSEPPGGRSNNSTVGDDEENENRPYSYDEDYEARKILRALQVYLKVATTRLMDDIPMTITYYLLHELGKEIKTEMSKFMIEKNFDEFLREDAAIEERRLALETKRERLDRANKELALFTL